MTESAAMDVLAFVLFSTVPGALIGFAVYLYVTHRRNAR